MDDILCLSCYPLWAAATAAVLVAGLVVLMWKHRFRIVAGVTWSLIRKLSESRLTTSAITVLVVIPLVYQFILQPFGVIKEWLSTFGVQAEISLTTLGIIVVGGLIVVAGRAIYTFFCPAFIKENKTDDAGRYAQKESDLVHAFALLIQSEHAGIPADDIGNSVRQFAADVGTPLTSEEVERITTAPSDAITAVEKLSVPEHSRATAFRNIYEFADRTRPVLRLVCLSCYCIGALFVFSPYLVRLVRFLVAWVH